MICICTRSLLFLVLLGSQRLWDKHFFRFFQTFHPWPPKKAQLEICNKHKQNKQRDTWLCWLVNNACIFIPHPYVKLDLFDFSLVFHVNHLSPLGSGHFTSCPHVCVPSSSFFHLCLFISSFFPCQIVLLCQGYTGCVFALSTHVDCVFSLACCRTSGVRRPRSSPDTHPNADPLLYNCTISSSRHFCQKRRTT